MQAPHLADRLDRLHTAFQANRWLRRFTWLVRILLAMGFIPSGLVKALALPFTSLSPETSVGYLFDAIYKAGFLYNFIGICQLLAAILLVIPYFATVGALVYLPIISGIYVLTISLDMRGTVWIAGLMLLGNIYLLCWDYGKLKLLLGGTPKLD